MRSIGISIWAVCLFAVGLPAIAKTTVVSLSQNIEYMAGDIIELKDSVYTVEIGSDPGTECAVPGFNCGSGYTPPHPTYKITCGKLKPCPWIILASHQSATTGKLSIESEKSCEVHDPENCFREFAKEFKSDETCAQLKTASGRYYCLKAYESSARAENKGLCDQLPESVYALRWNCFYEYAVRYRDPEFCEKYPAKDLSGRDRCFLKMAELLKNKSFCQKISGSKEHSYKEQCDSLILR